MTPSPTVTDPQGLALLVALWLAPLLLACFALGGALEWWG